MEFHAAGMNGRSRVKFTTPTVLNKYQQLEIENAFEICQRITYKPLEYLLTSVITIGTMIFIYAQNFLTSTSTMM